MGEELLGGTETTQNQKAASPKLIPARMTVTWRHPQPTGSTNEVVISTQLLFQAAGIFLASRLP